MSETDPNDVSVEMNLDAMFDASVKKKKKKKKKDKDKDRKDKKDKPASSGAASSGAESLPLTESPTYDYIDLLDRVFEQLHQNNPELTERKRHLLKPPQVMRVGTTRTCWTNFKEICDSIKRQPEHVQQFFLAELGTEGSLDAKMQFIMRGRFVPKKIESLLRKYIANYVTCQMCRSPLTELTRDQETRIYFVNCKACGASRSVAAIRQGYHAVARGERRKARR